MCIRDRSVNDRRLTVGWKRNKPRPSFDSNVTDSKNADWILHSFFCKKNKIAMRASLFTGSSYSGIYARCINILLFARIASSSSSARCGLYLRISWHSEVACFVCLSVFRPKSVCLSLCLSHVSAQKNGWTNQDAIWGTDWRGAKEPFIRWGWTYK